MLIFLRKLIVCLLVLAIPTPGFASAGMSACSPGHARMMSAPAADAQLLEAAQAPRHDHGSHRHTPQDVHGLVLQDLTAGAAVHLTDGTVNASVAEAQIGTKCSACAECCFGAALVSRAALPGAPEFLLTPLLAAAALPVSFVTDGPRRPPRSIPA